MEGELARDLLVLPPVDCYKIGYVGWSLKLTRKGAGAQPNSNLTIGVKKGEIEVQASRQNGFLGKKDAVSVKLGSIGIADLQAAIMKRSLAPIRSKLMGIEGTVGLVSVPNLELSAGIEWSLLPILVKGEASSSAGKLWGVEYSGKAQLQINFGPSPAGWTEIGKRVGVSALKLALQQGGATGVLKAVAASGAFTAATVALATVGTSFAILGATANYAGYVGKRGGDMGIATWYGSTYVNVLLGRPVPKPDHYDPGTRRRQQEMVDLAKSAVLNDARRHVADKNIAHTPSDTQEVLAIFAAALGEKFGALGTEAGERALRDFATDAAFEKIRADEW